MSYDDSFNRRMGYGTGALYVLIAVGVIALLFKFATWEGTKEALVGMAILLGVMIAFAALMYCVGFVIDKVVQLIKGIAE